MDGHKFAPQKLFFSIASADMAFHALKHLAEGESEAELLSNAVVENALVKKAGITWRGGTDEARKRIGGAVLMGSVTIDDTRLIVDVNSDERAGTIKALIEERLGEGATYERTVIEPLPPLTAKALQAKKTSSAAAADLSVREKGFKPLSDEESAQIHLFLDEKARQHWQTWLDLPVPALDNMTPRKAAGEPEGRELLETLLLSFEARDSHPSDDPFAPNVPKLRRELGME